MNDNSPRPRWRSILGILLLLGLGGLAARYFLVVPSVTVTHLTTGKAVTAVYASGTVEPVGLVKIAPRLMGRLAELAVDESAIVQRGAVLARLDDQELKANLAQLQARLDLAEREAARAEALLSRRTGTVQGRDKAASDLQAARAALTVAERQRAEYTLTAPQAGVIIRRDGEVGELIAANQAVFYLAGCSGSPCVAPLRITANIDEEDRPLVQAGQHVLLRADAFPQQSFTGTVESLTPKGDATARNFRVRIALPADTPLQIGMTTELNIIVKEQENAPLLPASAVRDGKVWVVREGRLAHVPVETAATMSDKIMVTSGVTPEDAVVVLPEENFKVGQKCRATMEAMP